MPDISIPDETFRRLSERAAALKISVSDLIMPTLESLGAPARTSDEPTSPLTGDAWRAKFEAMKRAAESRAGRYPPGFVLDDSREAMYWGEE
jgi:hypothetical protein